MWAVVVAQLVERSLPIPDVRSLNPVIGKHLYWTLFTFNCIEKTKIKEKEAGNGPFKKIPGRKCKQKNRPKKSMVESCLYPLRLLLKSFMLHCTALNNLRGPYLLMAASNFWATKYLSFLDQNIVSLLRKFSALKICICFAQLLWI